VPVVVEDFLAARERLVGGRGVRDVVDEALQAAVDEAAADGREEELLELVAAYVYAELPGVVALREREVVLSQ